ncbi:hypothetical protein [Agrobacterium radiobacter]|uniref:hypothetical protein n=1 Tax=Agrobacterium radiobacter TaxID=362 RepID=UPI003CE4B7A6
MDKTISKFFASANGDKWFLERDRNANEPTVIHRANPASGGAETSWSVHDFLKVAGDHPQSDALRNALAEPSGLEDGGDAQPAAVPNKAPTVYPWTR